MNKAAADLKMMRSVQVLSLLAFSTQFTCVSWYNSAHTDAEGAPQELMSISLLALLVQKYKY
jgi:hypothetical protein